MIVGLRRSSEKFLHNAWFMKVQNVVIIVGAVSLLAEHTDTHARTTANKRGQMKEEKEEGRSVTCKPELLTNLVGRFLGAGRFALHLKADLHDLERVGEDHLRGSCTSAGQNLEREVDLSRLGALHL